MHLKNCAPQIVRLKNCAPQKLCASKIVRLKNCAPQKLCASKIWHYKQLYIRYIFPAQRWSEHCGLHVCGQRRPRTHTGRREPGPRLSRVRQGTVCVAVCISPITPSQSPLTTSHYLLLSLPTCLERYSIRSCTHITNHTLTITPHHLLLHQSHPQTKQKKQCFAAA